MNFWKKPLLSASPFIALLAVFIFALVLYPSATMKPANLPVAILNLDEGAALPGGAETAMGEELVRQIRDAADAPGQDGVSPVKWVETDSYEAVRKGLDEQDYYGALIIPSDFSVKQATLRSPSPQAPEVEIWINQGMNATASNMVSQILTGMLTAMNQKISAQLLEGLEAGGVMLTPSQAATLTSPIAGKIVYMHETGSSPARANAPVSLFQPVWMGSIAGAAIITLVMEKALAGAGRRERVRGKLLQLAMGAVIALLVGFGMTWLADSMLKLEVPQLADMGWFLTLAVFSFYLMISAVLSWTGIRGIVVFVLLLFFGAPLLAMPPEFMNGFYRDWLYSWLPMRFMVDGLRELFFFEAGFGWNTPVAMLAGIAAVGLVVLLLSALKPSRSLQQ